MFPPLKVRIGARTPQLAKGRRELEEGVLGVGREACQDGKLQRPRDTRGFEPACIASLALHCRCLLLLIAGVRFCLFARPTAKSKTQNNTF